MKSARLSCIVLGLASVLPLAANAQWQWVDNAGKKVFSDQAPPPEIAEKNILRRPGGAPGRSVAPPVVTPTDAGSPTAAAAPPVRAASGAVRAGGVDKELEEKTRKAEEAEKAKQAAEAQKQAQVKAENCSRARQSKATYDSGIRVARLNAQGEREIMDDKARAEEQQRLQGVINSDCK